jgi:hypothetical protein
VKTTKTIIAVSDKHRISLCLEEIERKNGEIASLKDEVAALKLEVSGMRKPKPKPARKANAKANPNSSDLAVGALVPGQPT